MPGSSGPTERAAATPVLLTDPALAWLAERGSVDVFLVQVRDGEAMGVRHHVLRVPPGQMLFGVAPGSDGRALLAVPTPDAGLRAVPRAALAAPTLPADGRAPLAESIDAWITMVSRALAGDVLPRVFAVLEAGQALAVKEQARVLLPRDGVV